MAGSEVHVLVFKHGLHLKAYILKSFISELGDRTRTDMVQ